MADLAEKCRKDIEGRLLSLFRLQPRGVLDVLVERIREESAMRDGAADSGTTWCAIEDCPMMR
jgi:hypothetical protein